jgi:hypothetical protein
VNGTSGSASRRSAKPATGRSSSRATRGVDAELLAVDASGATVWQKSYRSSGGLAPSDLWVSPDGSPTIVGTTRPGDDREDAWAMRLGPLGDPVWSKHYGRETTDRGAGVTGFDDGRIALAATQAWGSPEDVDEVWVLYPGADGRAGSQGFDLPLAVDRLNVAPLDTAVRVGIPPIEVSTATVRVTRTQAGVRAVP